MVSLNRSGVVYFTGIYSEDLMVEIFIRYRHSNLNDLREFYEYELPDNTEYRVYEKSLGSNISHFKVTQS